jgi:magnesium and cobalt exporter, CNNM family
LDIQTGVLVGTLIFLILLSAFFSASEIALMAINRYRLRYQAQSGHRGAIRVSKLLERPDRLLGIILLGNNTANIAASIITTLLAIKLVVTMSLEVYQALITTIAGWGLLFLILVFAEVAPKTYAASNPEKVAFPAALILQPLLKGLYPIVLFVNFLAQRFLRLFGITLKLKSDQLGSDELRAAVMETRGLLPSSHRTMLLGILDLEKIVVDDVMVPRGRIEGIDIDEDWDDILEQITSCRYTRLPVYHGSLDDIVGIVHTRKVLNLMRNDKLDRESFMSVVAEPYFIPKGTALNTQLINFKQNKRRRGLVVDEYGEIIGLVTLEEILEEIIGDFTTQAYDKQVDATRQKDGSYLVKGEANLRDLNRNLDWSLPIDDSRTLNGLITEYLEDIPEPGTSIKLGKYQIDVVRTRGTAVEVAQIRTIETKGNSEETETAE